MSLNSFYNGNSKCGDHLQKLYRGFSKATKTVLRNGIVSLRPYKDVTISKRGTEISLILKTLRGLLSVKNQPTSIGFISVQ